MTTIETIVPFGEGGASVARVECRTEPGVGIQIVGCVPEAVKEVILRVAAALQSCGHTIPGKKTVINIAPALPKGASVADAAALDLPVALAIIAESRGLNVCGNLRRMSKPSCAGRSAWTPAASGSRSGRPAPATGGRWRTSSASIRRRSWRSSYSIPQVRKRR